jgi:hypothetical protein
MEVDEWRGACSPKPDEEYTSDMIEGEIGLFEGRWTDSENGFDDTATGSIKST